MVFLGRDEIAGRRDLAQVDLDVIQLDAFLKPSAETDGTGAPLNLRTRQFYKEVQSKLSPGGLVAFNLNLHDKLGDDIRNISGATLSCQHVTEGVQRLSALLEVMKWTS